MRRMMFCLVAVFALALVLPGCEGGGKCGTCCKDSQSKCKKCGMAMKCDDMAAKCSGCGKMMRCGDMTMKCKGCGKEMACSQAKGGKCACGKAMTCESKCAGCGKMNTMKCTGMCEKCASAKS